MWFEYMKTAVRSAIIFVGVARCRHRTQYPIMTNYFRSNVDAMASKVKDSYNIDAIACAIGTAASFRDLDVCY